jgi:hypothetical protein
MAKERKRKKQRKTWRVKMKNERTAAPRRKGLRGKKGDT